jgi:polyphosphate kinase 2 (PPK2 family)
MRSTASALEVSDMAKKNKQHHPQAPASASVASGEAAADPPAKLKRKAYEGEMRRLHGELVAMQEWVKASGAKLCIVSRVGTPPGRGGRSSGSPSG